LKFLKLFSRKNEGVRAATCTGRKTLQPNLTALTTGDRIPTEHRLKTDVKCIQKNTQTLYTR